MILVSCYMMNVHKYAIYHQLLEIGTLNNIDNDMLYSLLIIEYFTYYFIW